MDSSRRTPLHKAAENNHVSVARALLEAGAKVEIKTLEAETALHRAAFAGNEKLVKLLLEWKVGPRMAGAYSNRPLHYACMSGNIEVVKALLDKIGSSALNDEFNQQNDASRTPLHLAAENGHDSIIQELIARGAEIDQG